MAESYTGSSKDLHTAHTAIITVEGLEVPVWSQALCGACS